MDDWKTGVHPPAGAELCLCHDVQNGAGAHQASCHLFGIDAFFINTTKHSKLNIKAGIMPKLKN
jgi:hypothetical protein